LEYAILMFSFLQCVIEQSFQLICSWLTCTQ